MSRAVDELSWELVTGEAVVRVTADRVDAATRWGLHDPAGGAPEDGELRDGELLGDELLGDDLLRVDL